jgi:hypothetical protein
MGKVYRQHGALLSLHFFLRKKYAKMSVLSSTECSKCESYEEMY